MSVLFLSLFLVFLVALGMLMAPSGVREYFANPTSYSGGSSDAEDPTPVTMVSVKPDPLRINPMARDLDAKNAQEKQKCPDMSQYVRLDEVPCWNCTLP